MAPSHSHSSSSDEGRRRRGGGGRQSSSLSSSLRSNQSSSLSSSLRSNEQQHHVLPQDFALNLSPPPAGAGSCGGTSSSSSPHHQQHRQQQQQQQQQRPQRRQQQRRPRPPPPPPPPPPFRGAPQPHRARSLSTARSSGAKPSSSSSHVGPTSRRGEEKKAGRCGGDDRRGRSLSVARPRPAPPSSDDGGNGRAELPAIDVNGERRPRRGGGGNGNGNGNGGRSRSRSKPRTKSKPSGGGGGKRDSSRVRRRAAAAHTASSAAAGDDASVSFKRVAAENVRRSPARGRSASRSRRGAGGGGCDRTTSKAGVPSSSSSSSASKPDGKAIAKADKPSSESTAKAKPSSKPADPSKSKSRAGDRSKSRADPSEARNGRSGDDDRRGSSDEDASSKARSDSTSSSRKFVVEISDSGEVVQVFEFSDGGAPPSALGGDASRSGGGDDDVLEKLRRTYSGARGGSSGSGLEAPSRGRPRSRHPSPDDASSVGTKRIVVETDDNDDVVSVLELASGSDSRASDRRDRDRDGSPFSEREAYLEEREGRRKDWKDVREGEGGVPPSSESKGPAASEPHDRNQNALAVLSPPAPLRSSLRSSFRDSNRAQRQASVSFLLADDGEVPSVSLTLAREEPAASSDSDREEESPESLNASHPSLLSFKSPSPPSSESLNFSDPSLLSKSSSQGESAHASSDPSLLSKSSSRGSSAASGSSPPSSSATSVRRSVSFATLDSAGESTMRRSVSFRLDQPPAPARGRSSASARSMSDDDLPGFRRARSLSTSRRGAADVADGSGPPPPRGRSGPAAPPPMPRQARSLSRPRDSAWADAYVRGGVAVRDAIDFDPPMGAPHVGHRPRYDVRLRRDALPFEEVPPMPPVVPRKSLAKSHRTAETYASTLTCDSTEDSFLVSSPRDAPLVAGSSLRAVAEEDPLMNSELTILEGGDDDQSLLSDPASFADPIPGPRDRDADQLVYGDDDLAASERRSKIRDMLSRKAYRKRRDQRRGGTTSHGKALDASDTTRETTGTDGSDDPAALVEGARDSLRQLQGHPLQVGLSTRASEGKAGTKSRLSRLLRR